MADKSINFAEEANFHILLIFIFMKVIMNFCNEFQRKNNIIFLDCI